jgi:uncharacterized protein (DUF934 family)
MLRLIRNGTLEVNEWRIFDNSSAPLPRDEAYWMVSLATWKDNFQLLSKRKHPVGILVPPHAEPKDILSIDVSDLNHQPIALIAIDFPIYTDGRGFSLAQILRTQHGWTGELRAVGDVLIDTIHYLARCGFDSFLVKEGHDPELALKAFETFTVHYQKSYGQPVKILT